MERENGSCSELRPSIFFRVQSLKCVITRGCCRGVGPCQRTGLRLCFLLLPVRTGRSQWDSDLLLFLFSPPCHPDYFLPAWIVPKLSFQQAEIFGEKSCLLVFGFGWIEQGEEEEEERVREVGEEEGGWRGEPEWWICTFLYFGISHFSLKNKTKLSKCSRNLSCFYLI